MTSSGPVETEIRQPFRRREKLRLSLHLQRNMQPAELNPAKIIMEHHFRTIDAHELARKMNVAASKPFLLLDCRPKACFTGCHIKGAVHFPVTDRFNRRRIQSSGSSVLESVGLNNRRKGSCPVSSAALKVREVIVYDDGLSRLGFDDPTTSSPTAFLIAHLIHENKQPIYLEGGIKEFSRCYSELCENLRTLSDLSMDSPRGPTFCIPPPLNLLASPFLPPFSPPECNQGYENEPPTQVLPFLYVGNARDADDPDLLRRLGISYVLSVTTTCPQSFKDVVSVASTESQPNLNEIPKEPEFHTKLIPVSDNLVENLAPYFEEACDFIEEARTSGTRVLIHCHAGISRSPTIAIAYIMKHINLSTQDAYAFVQKYRRIISPNLNFMGQLIEFETKLKGHSNASDSSCSTSTSSVSSDSSGASEHLMDDLSLNLVM